MGYLKRWERELKRLIIAAALAAAACSLYYSWVNPPTTSLWFPYSFARAQSSSSIPRPAPSPLQLSEIRNSDTPAPVPAPDFSTSAESILDDNGTSRVANYSANSGIEMVNRSTTDRPENSFQRNSNKGPSRTKDYGEFVKRNQELLLAKKEIENSWDVVDDPDLYGPLYHNVSKFKKSYELMEKIFKVYIYREGQKPYFHTAELKGIYASEGWFMRLMGVNKQFVVRDPRKAHMFYLPYSVYELVRGMYVPDSHNMHPLQLFLRDYVNMIAAKYPFWNRTKGADHFIVACHDWDSHLSSSHHADEHPRLRDDRRFAEVVGFSGLGDSRVPRTNSDAYSDRHRGDKDAEPSEVLWIGFPNYMKVDEMRLKKEFSPFGEIEHITTFPGRTYAFVQFRSVVAACRAKEALQGKLFSNPRVNICFSKSEVGPLEHGRNSANGTLPFSHKVTISSGIGSKVVENLRQERSHGITHGALGMPSPSFSSNLERMHSGSNVNLLGRANSMKTISGGYDDIRATRLGSDLGATKEVSELSVNSPGLERSPFWHTNTPDKSRGGGSYFEDNWDSSADDMASREVKRPRFGAVPGRDPSEVPFPEQGRDLQRFYPPRTGAMNSGPEGYKFSQFPIGNDGDVGASHCNANILADNARQSTRSSHQIDAPWNAPINFESVVGSAIPPPLDSAKWDDHTSDTHHGPLKEEWKWQGTIAKGGTPVCRARCFPVRNALDVTLPEFLNCTARTGLDMLAKHFYQAGSVGVVFFVPENDPDIIPYNEFKHYLGEKQRAAVAKLGEGTTLFLVPPSQFAEEVLKVPGNVSISGVILKFQQLNTSYGSPGQPSSELMNVQPQSLLHRSSITSGPTIHDDSCYPNPPSPFSHQRYSGQGNINLYSEHFQSPNATFSSWQPLPSSSAGPIIYQGPGSGGAPSTGSFGGTMNTNIVNENRPHHPSPQNQGFTSSWSSLNPERTLVSNSRVGTFVSDSSNVLMSSQSEFASTQQSLTVQQQQSCTPATNSEQQFLGVPNNASIGQIDQNQQLQRPFHPTSVSIPQLQHDHLAQLATLLGQRPQSAQLPVSQPVQESQQQPSPPISQAPQNFSAVPQANLQVQSTASVQSSSGQFSYGHQLQQHTSQLAALPRGGHVNDLAAAESQIVPDNQTQNDGREESEPDPQKRLQATLQLAAALLQQIQQQSRTGDQQ